MTPQRARSHQLEDESKLAFQGILPKPWVFRGKTHDYGIDGEVEIFDASGMSTGQIFYVQLKGTDETDINKALKVQMKIETMAYFASLNYPVLIVRYLSGTKEMFVRWAHAKLDNRPKKDQKTTTITINAEDKIEAQTCDRLSQSVGAWLEIRRRTIELPVRIGIVLHDNIIDDVSVAQIIAANNSFAGSYRAELIILDEGSDGNLLGHVKCANDGSMLHIAGGNASFGFKQPPKEAGDLQTWIANLHIGLAILLAQFHHLGVASKLVLRAYRFTDALLGDRRFYARVFALLASGRYYSELVQFVKDTLCDKTINSINILVGLSGMATNRYHVESDYRLEIYTAMREFAVLHEECNVFIGSLEYNIGYIYRGQEMHRAAIRQYNRARKREPKYMDRAYFWAEIAGSLFLIGHFSCSAASYKRSLDLDDSGSDVLDRYADALLFAGCYKEAFAQFQLWHNKTEKPNPLSLLKYYCLSILPGELPKNQIRQSLRALAVVSWDKSAISESDIDHALKLDVLCSLAWFRLGELHLAEKKYTDAMHSFLWSAITDEHHVPAWVNATALAYQLKNLEMIGWTQQAGYQTCGQHFLNGLFESVDASNAKPKRREFVKMKILEFQNVCDEIAAETSGAVTIAKSGSGGIRMERD